MNAATLEGVLHQLRGLLPPAARDQNAPDAELLGRFVAHRDEGAFGELLRRHGRLVYGVCRRVLGDAHAAEDAFQATFLLLAQRASRLRQPRSVAGWLHGVAQRMACQARRAEQRRRCRERRYIPPSATYVDDLAWGELRQLLDAELARLPEKYRSPLILCYLEGLTQAEAAQRLGWTDTVLRGRLERGRQALRRLLARLGLPLAAPLLMLGAPAPVSAALRAATLATVRAAAGGSLVAPAVAALVAGGSGLLGVAKWKLVIGLALVVAAVGLGAAAVIHSSSTPPTQSAPPPLVAATGDVTKVRVDLLGDPLPPGALVRLGTVRYRHSGNITGVAFSADGSTLATSGYRALRFWDARTGKLRRTISPPGYMANALALSADGKTLVSAGGLFCAEGGLLRGGVRLWDFASGKELRRFEKPDVHADFLALSPDGTRAALATRGKPTVHLWDLTTGSEFRSLDAKGFVFSLTFSPDGRMLAVCCDNGKVRLWAVATGKEAVALAQEGLRNLFHAAFSPDGTTLAAGAVRFQPGFQKWDSPVVLWDVATGKQRRQLLGHRRATRFVAYSPDGKTLASANYDHSIILWDVGRGKPRFQFSGLPDSAVHLTYSRDGRILAAGGYDGVVRLWEVATGRQLPSPAKGHQSTVTQLVFAPDGRSVATASMYDPTICLWDPNTGEQRLVLRGHEDPVRYIAFSPDGTLLASAGADDTVRVWDRVSGKETRRFTAGATDGLRSVQFTADGKRLLAVGGDLRLQSWDVADGKKHYTRPLRPGGLKDPPAEKLERELFGSELAFSPDGKLLALHLPLILGPAVYLLDGETGRELGKLDAHQGIIASLAFSPDAKQLVSAGSGRDSSLHVWDVPSGTKLPALGRGDESFGCVAVSPDGKAVASSAKREDGAIHLWEVATGREFFRLPGNDSEIRSLAFAPDGKTLAAGMWDTTALIWDLAPPTARRGRPGTGFDRNCLEKLWADLAGEDAPKAYEALWAFVGVPEQAVPFLQSRLRPVSAPEPQRLTRLLADLESRQFSVRQKASIELERLGDLAEAALRKILEANPGLETRKRIERLLEKLRGPVTLSEKLCILRAIQVLERIGSQEARLVLDAVAKGAPESRLTQEARASLNRLARRLFARP